MFRCLPPFLLLALLATACSQMSPVSPTPPAVAAAAPVAISYAINLPDQRLVQQLQTQYPDGIAMAPIAAQIAYDYTSIYGASNVYFGPMAPPDGMYTRLGIVVAPVDAARVLIFPASAWPQISRGLPADARLTWIGRFVYVAAGAVR